MKKNITKAALMGPKRCVCAKCAHCIDNARWERIFQEKYGQQERDYYAARKPRSSGVSAKALEDASIYAWCPEEISVKPSSTENNIDRFYNLLAA